MSGQGNNPSASTSAPPNYWRVLYCYKGKVQEGHTCNCNQAVIIFKKLVPRGWIIGAGCYNYLQVTQFLRDPRVETCDGGWHPPLYCEGSSKGLTEALEELEKAEQRAKPGIKRAEEALEKAKQNSNDEEIKKAEEALKNANDSVFEGFQITPQMCNEHVKAVEAMKAESQHKGNDGQSVSN